MPVLPHIDRELVLLHVIGSVSATVVVTVLMTVFESSPGHPVGFVLPLQWFAIWLGIFVILTPLLLPILAFWRVSFWRVSYRRYRILESALLLRLVGMFVLVAGTAAILDLLGWCASAIARMIREDAPFLTAPRNAYPLQTYAFLLLITTSWAVIPLWMLYRRFGRVRSDEHPRKVSAAGSKCAS